MAERHGIIATSTGLLFVAGSDSKIRAFEAETGKILWTAQLPAGSEGIPAMYEVNGRQYLVVPSSTQINAPGGHAEAPNLLRGYVAFALPEHSQRIEK